MENLTSIIIQHCIYMWLSVDYIAYNTGPKMAFPVHWYLQEMCMTYGPKFPLKGSATGYASQGVCFTCCWVSMLHKT